MKRLAVAGTAMAWLCPTPLADVPSAAKRINAREQYNAKPCKRSIPMDDMNLKQAQAAVAAALAKAGADRHEHEHRRGRRRRQPQGVCADGRSVARIDRHRHPQGPYRPAIRYEHAAKSASSRSPADSLFGIEHSNGGLISFPGGVPIRNQAGTVVGAIGVSGSTVENDHAVAEAGAAAVT